MISDEYRAKNVALHKAFAPWGTGGGREYKKILALCDKYGSTDILDFGCGKGWLKKALELDIAEYDPGIPEKDEIPTRSYDIIVADDVLEHIEPEFLDETLSWLREHTKKAFYAVISTRLSRVRFLDGSNPHRIVAGPNWWDAKLLDYFEHIEGHYITVLEEYTVICEP